MVVVASCAGSVLSFRRATGELAWEHNLGAGFHAEPVVAGSTYVVPVDDGTVAAFDVAQGAKLWQQTVGPPGRISGLLQAPDRVVGVSHSMPFFLSVESGAFLIGGAATLELGTVEQNPANGDGFGVFVMPSGFVEAIEIETGVHRWTADLAATPSSGVVAAAGGFLVATEDGRVHHLDSQTGAVKVSFAIPTVLADGPVLVDGLLIGTTRANEIVAVEIATGKLAWQREDQRWISPRLLVAGGEVLAGTVDGLLAGLDPATGETVWERQLSGVMKGFTRVGNDIYVGNQDGMLFAVSLHPPSDQSAEPAPRNR